MSIMMMFRYLPSTNFACLLVQIILNPTLNPVEVQIFEREVKQQTYGFRTVTFAPVFRAEDVNSQNG
jgi:hypothetical protein